MKGVFSFFVFIFLIGLFFRFSWGSRILFYWGSIGSRYCCCFVLGVHFVFMFVGFGDFCSVVNGSL